MAKPVSTFTQEMADTILELIATGEPTRVICRRPGFPKKSTLTDWRKANPDFDAAYQVAKEAGYDEIAEDCLDIADDGSRDYTADEDGRQVVDHDHIQRSKLRVDTRLKLLAKWSPRYREKLDMAIDASVKASVVYQANLPPRLPKPDGD